MRNPPSINLSINLLTGALIILVSSFVSNAQSRYATWDNGITSLEGYKTYFTMGLTDGELRVLESKWLEIGESLARKNESFEGTYAETGYNSGYFLRFSIDKGYVLIPYFDQNLIVDFGYGRVEITEDSELRLIPVKELEGIGRRLKLTPRLFIPAYKGEFMVPAGELMSFGNYYAGFGEFNGFPRKRLCEECGTFAKRVDERKGRVLENFAAPPKYIPFLRSPIKGLIIFVGKRRYGNAWNSVGFFERSSITPVQINVGKRSGVTKGMMFLLVPTTNKFDEVLKITRVSSTKAEGVVVRTIDEKGRESYDGDFDKATGKYKKVLFPLLKAGTKITTSPLID